MAKYRNRYRIESARKPGWDYRNEGAYFITICTHNRIHHFGECNNGRMKLSTMGLIVQGCWYEIPRLNDPVRLGEFVVMPNHIHGVLILDGSVMNVDSDDLGGMGYSGEMLKFNVSTVPIDPVEKSQFFADISPKSGSVSRILGQFKRACTNHIKRAFSDTKFEWQERFHDHVIRDAASFLRISNYIRNNPAKWKNDCFNNGDGP